jgi:hypothetical protein
MNTGQVHASAVSNFKEISGLMVVKNDLTAQMFCSHPDAHLCQVLWLEMYAYSALLKTVN